MEVFRDTEKNTAESTTTIDPTGTVTTLVDHGALKSNQLIIIALSLLAFVVESPALVAGTALVMATGTLLGKPGFLPLYARILRPSGLVKPEVLPDNPGPHRFAQGFGSIVMFAGAFALFSGAPLAGWILVWLVVFLAGINAFAGFCAGCFLYYQLGRLGLPGFAQTLAQNRRPGFKPPKRGGLHV